MKTLQEIAQNARTICELEFDMPATQMFLTANGYSRIYINEDVRNNPLYKTLQIKFPNRLFIFDDVTDFDLNIDLVYTNVVSPSSNKNIERFKVLSDNNTYVYDGGKISKYNYDTYSIVLITDTTKHYNTVGFSSFDRYLNTFNLDAFYIICPKTDMSFYSSMLSHSKIPYKIIDRDSFNPDIRNLEPDSNYHRCDYMEEWIRDRIIRLKVSSIIKSKYYILIEPTHFLCKPFSYNNLFYLSESNQFKLKYEARKCDDAYKNTSMILNCESSIFNLMALNLPQTLITEHTKTMLNTITKTDKELRDNNVSELALYWTYLSMNNLTHLYDSKYSLLPYFKRITSFSIGHINNLSYTIEGRNLFLIASMITSNFKNHHFTPIQRYHQLLNTIESVRRYAPQSKCVIIEGSKITEEQRSAISKGNVLLEFSGDPTLLSFRNNGIGELILLKTICEYVMNKDIKYDRLFKLGGRYELNEDFNINKWIPNRYCFRTENNRCITGLYSVPNIKTFISLIDTCLPKLTDDNEIEMVFYETIKDKIHMPVIGLRGQLSYNGTLFNK